MFHSSNPNGFVAVVLLDGFSLLDFGSITEPFSYLSRKRPNIAPKLILVGLDGLWVQSRSGVRIECEEDGAAFVERLARGRAPARIILCGPTGAIPTDASLLPSVLRIAWRNRVSIYGIGSAIWHMAELGMLHGGTSTVHWSLLAAFTERHIDVDTQNALYTMNDRIVSCAGETATLDMVLKIISSISPNAAQETANHLLVAYPRAGTTTQPGSRSSRLRGVPSLVSEAVRVMADHVEDPIQATHIAERCDVSVRKLERLFQKHLGTSPMQYYTNLRLEHAHDLVMHTDMSLLDIAIACGFGSSGALTKKFKRNFVLTPSQMRDRDPVGAAA